MGNLRLMVLKKVTEHSGKKVELKNMTWNDWIDKLLEETDELVIALHSKDKKQISEEVMDVLQVCIGIISKLVRERVDIFQIIHRHNKKLCDRVCEFTAEIRFHINRK